MASLSKPGAFAAANGDTGVLHVSANTRRHGRVEFSGRYRYVGMVDGMRAFAPATPEPVIYVHDPEIVRFDLEAQE